MFQGDCFLVKCGAIFYKYSDFQFLLGLAVLNVFDWTDTISIILKPAAASYLTVWLTFLIFILTKMTPFDISVG